MTSRRTAKLPTTENDVKKLVIDWYKIQGGWSFAPPPSRGMGVHGISDRLGVVPVKITPAMVGKTVGLFVAIEAKKPGRRGEENGGATQAQSDFLREVLLHGGLGALADSELDLIRAESAINDLRHSPILDWTLPGDQFLARLRNG